MLDHRFTLIADSKPDGTASRDEVVYVGVECGGWQFVLAVALSDDADLVADGAWVTYVWPANGEGDDAVDGRWPVADGTGGQDESALWQWLASDPEMQALLKRRRDEWLDELREAV